MQINQINQKNHWVFGLFYKNHGIWFKPNKPWFLPTLKIIHAQKLTDSTESVS